MNYATLPALSWEHHIIWRRSIHIWKVKCMLRARIAYDAYGTEKSEATRKDFLTVCDTLHSAHAHPAGRHRCQMTRLSPMTAPERCHLHITRNRPMRRAGSHHAGPSLPSRRGARMAVNIRARRVYTRLIQCVRRLNHPMPHRVTCASTRPSSGIYHGSTSSMSFYWRVLACYGWQSLSHGEVMLRANPSLSRTSQSRASRIHQWISGNWRCRQRQA